MHITFPGKRILVAGAARGIGRAIAEAFARCGAEVFAADLLVDEVARFAGPAGGGGTIHALAADVTDPASVAAMVAEAGGASAEIDGLVYVAGGVRGQSPHPIEEVDPEDWRAIVDANLTGAFLCARAVAPVMKRAGQGRIVIISSRSGLATSLTGIQSYAAAKHGQLGLMKQLADELGPHGVTVNAVAPGFMPTSPDYERQWAGYGEAGQKALIERVAMRRLGRPEDIAHAVLFFAAPASGWITGQTLSVDGGK